MQLKQLGYTYNGLTGKSKKDFGHGQGKYITFLNVLNNTKIDHDILEKVDVLPTEKQNTVQKGDLFFNTSSEIPEEVGMCAVLDTDLQETYLNSFCFGFRLKEIFSNSVLPLYLVHLFNGKYGRNTMKMLAQGATRYNLSKEQFLKIIIPVPDIRTQHSVVNILTDIEDKILSLKHRIAKYESIKKATVRKLMTPTSEWEMTTIENIANVVTGATPSTTVSEYWDNATIPWMNSGEINNRFITQTKNSISQLGYERTSTHLIKPNSVLVALAGQGTTRGKVAINRIKLCTNQSLAAITPYRPEDYGFIFWNLDSRYDELRSISTGDGGRGGLNLHLIKTLSIQLPDEKTRDKISTKLFSLFQLVDKLYNQMIRLKDMKQSMLQYFFG
ncbi:MAG: restriction endonuclease subunit S [Oligosphaeraceae bacterium]